MKTEPTLFSTMGELKRVVNTPMDRQTRTRPRVVRKISIVDNKHNPDFYITGIIAAFLGIQFLCKWYPVLQKQDGHASFLRGLSDADEAGFEFKDILGDLWRVRRTDSRVFDAALCLKHGWDRACEILRELSLHGESEFLKRQKERDEEMEFYGNIDAEWLGKYKFIAERKREQDAQL